MPLTPEERAENGRLGAYVQQSRHYTRQITAAARSALEQRFLDEVDPDRVLAEAERERRAEAARRAYYVRLSMQATKARKARASRPSDR